VPSATLRWPAWHFDKSNRWARICRRPRRDSFRPRRQPQPSARMAGSPRYSTMMSTCSVPPTWSPLVASFTRT
jgi:hypothetical protein